MKLLSRAVLLTSLLASGAVQAHAHLVSSMPAEGTTLATVPTTVVLTLSEPGRIASAAVQRGIEAKPALLNFPAAAAATVRLSLPALSSGAYTVSWRAVGCDGHVIFGELHFAVASTDAKGIGSKH